MASIIDTIENSSVIKGFKAAYDKATTQAEKDAIHNAANLYREQQGGYKDVYKEGEGTAFTRVITNSALLNDTASEVKNAATKVVDKITNTTDTIKAEQEAAENPITIIDTPTSNGSYNASDYLITSSSSTASSLDEILGYGLLGLVAIAVLSRLVSGKKK